MNDNHSFSVDPETGQILQKHIDSLRLIDDIFFRACLKDNPRAAEAIIRVALNMPDAKVESVSIQDESAFPNYRNVRFDLKVRGADGKLFDVEVQKGNDPDLPFRSRYYLSALTVQSLRSGQAFGEMPEAYVLFICEFDPFGKGMPYYSYALKNESDGTPHNDGGHIVYLNCSYRGNDPYGTLSKDMTCPDYSRMHDPVLRDTVMRGKIRKREEEGMSDITKQILEVGEKKGEERGKKIGAEESKKEIALNLLKMGDLTPEQIAEATGLPLETVLSLKQ